VRKSKPANSQDDKKLQGALKKLNVQPITGVEEVNMFREDGNVLHFTAPKGESPHQPSPHPPKMKGCRGEVRRHAARSGALRVLFVASN